MSHSPSQTATEITINGSMVVAQPHQNAEGQLELAPIIRLTCCSLFQMYQPLKEYWQTRPKVLIVCLGEHTHPIPLPTKTPPAIHSNISASFTIWITTCLT